MSIDSNAPPANFKQVLVVYNPASGTVGDFDKRLGAMVRHFAEEKGYVVNARPITTEMTSAEMLAPVMGPFELVVAVGGDGTVGFVLGAVAESGLKIPVGIVPFGTGNLLARALKISTGKHNEDPLDRAMDTIMHGDTISLDLGKLDGRWFTIDAGTGPLADAITKPVKAHKTTFRLFAYGWPLLKSLTHRPLRYELTIDDGEKLDVEASGIFITNSSEMGIGAEGIEHLSDGVLDLLVMNPRSIADYWRILVRFFRWFILNQDSGHVPYVLRKVKKVYIEMIPKQVSRSPLHRFARKTRDVLSGKTHVPKLRFEADMMVDGEPCGKTPCTVEIVPAAVLVRVPKGEAPTSQSSANNETNALNTPQSKEAEDYKDAAKYFQKAYTTDIWQGKQSRSGNGSEGEFAKEKIELLRSIIDTYKIKSVIDIGCGDMYWMQEVIPLLDSYLGIDVVEDLIADNQTKFGTDKVKFQRLDIINESSQNVLPNSYDLIISLDVFGHLLNPELDKMVSFMFSKLKGKFLLVKNRKDATSSNFALQGKGRSDGVDLDFHPMFAERNLTKLLQKKSLWPDDYFELYSME